VEVQDLFVDVRDGRVLMALLEELSGCKLVSTSMRKNESESDFKYKDSNEECSDTLKLGFVCKAVVNLCTSRNRWAG